MPNSVFHGQTLDGATVNAGGVGDAQAVFNTSGIAEVDSTDTNLVSAINGQGGAQVDVEGTEEALTAGTVQTATTLSAIAIRNDTGATVLNIRDTDATGTLHIGPITIAANLERIIVFPQTLTIAGGVFIDVDSGALNATPGYLIP